MEKRDTGELHGQFASREAMCFSCVYRDKTEVKIGLKIIKCGATRDNCQKYVKGENRKPYDVLFEGARCAFYRGE